MYIYLFHEANKNAEAITVIKFIYRTMNTLSNYWEWLKTQVDFYLTQQEK